MTGLKSMTLESLRDALHNLDTLSEDVVVSPKEVKDVSLNGFTLPNIGYVPMTEAASTQLAERTGIPGSVIRYLRHNHPDQAQDVLLRSWKQYLREVKADSKLLIRARDYEGLKVRAALSGRYGIIDSKDVVQALIDVLPQNMAKAKIDGLCPEIWLDPLTGALSFKGILDEVGGDGFFRGREQHRWGITGGNDECGRGSAHFDLLFERLVCTNQFSGLGMGKTRQSHVVGKSGSEKFQNRLDEWMRGRFRNPSSALSKYRLLNGVPMTDPPGSLVKLGSEAGLPKRDLEEVAEFVLPSLVQEVGSNGYAIVNSLTQFARGMEDRARQALWEQAAGRVVNLIPV